jgi:hypothetical protein
MAVKGTHDHLSQDHFQHHAPLYLEDPDGFFADRVGFFQAQVGLLED